MSDGAADDSQRAIRRATPSDVTALVGVLTRAFDDDRLYNWLLPQDLQRAARFDGIFRLILEHMSDDLRAEAFTTADLSGCALWLRPGKHKLSLLRQARLLPHFVRVLGWRGIPRGMRLVDHMDTLHARLAPKPHSYLSLLGVDPRLQRHGLGGRLLKPMLERCDSRTPPRDDPLPENVAFYERHLASCSAIRAEHGDFPTFFCMAREPR